MSIADKAIQAVKDRMEIRFQAGTKNQRDLLRLVGDMTIKDRLIGPRFTFFRTADPGLVVEYGLAEKIPFTIHQHALGQLCNKVGLPMDYVNRLNGKDSEQNWRLELLAHNLNELFHNTAFKTKKEEDTAFLHRIVGTELRGFLSRRFNRNLASYPMLSAFVAATSMAGAFPVEATATSVRSSLTSYLPHVLQPIPDVPSEMVAIGVCWANSDFGAGSLRVSQVIWRPTSGTQAILDESFSKVHLGSVIKESDIEMSEETMNKDEDAVASAIRDTVLAQLSTDTIRKIMQAIKTAHEEEIPWTQLKNQLGKFLYKTEIEQLDTLLKNSANEGVIDLPPVKNNPSKWWASQAVAWVANSAGDKDRRLDLLEKSGQLLSPKVV